MLLKKSVVRFVIVAVAAGLLVFLAGISYFGPWRDRILDFGLPVFSLSRLNISPIGSWFRGGAGEKLQQLEEEKIRMLARIAELETLERENEILRSALELRKEGEQGVIGAKAIGFFREGRDEFLLLNRGTLDGIGIGDLVLDRNRILGGTVVDVSARTSRVILLSSPSRSIDVLIPSVNLRAISRGSNFRELIIDLVPQDSALKIGDSVMASSRAAGGRPPMLVGQIREVRQAENDVFKTVRALHMFDPAEEDVLVLLAP